MLARILRLLALSSVVALPFAACGPGASPSPSSGDARAKAPTSTPALKLYFLQDGKVFPVRRGVAPPQAVASAAMRALLKEPTPAEKADGFETAMPQGTRLLGVAIRGGMNPCGPRPAQARAGPSM